MVAVADQRLLLPFPAMLACVALLVGQSWPPVILADENGQLGNKPLRFVSAHDLGQPSSGELIGVCGSAVGDVTYATDGREGILYQLSRSRDTGTLLVEHTYQEKWRRNGDSTSRVLTDFHTPCEMRVSRDDRYLYVATASSDAIHVFRRSRKGRSLKHLQVVKEHSRHRSTGIYGLDQVEEMVISPDGRHLYAGSTIRNAIAVFSIDKDTGHLHFLNVLQGARLRDGHIAYPQSSVVQWLKGPLAMAIDPDGRHMYVTSFDKAMLLFARDSSTGQLTLMSTISDIDTDRNRTRPTYPALTFPYDIQISSGGRHVYVTGSADTVAMFRRDKDSGSLEFGQLWQGGSEGRVDMRGAKALCLHPDGKHVFVAAEGSHSLVVFRRSPDDGSLAFVQVFQDGKAGVDGLLRVRNVWVSPDGKFVYTVSGERAIAIFALKPESQLEGQVSIKKQTGGRQPVPKSKASASQVQPGGAMGELEQPATLANETASNEEATDSSEEMPVARERVATSRAREPGGRSQALSAAETEAILQLKKLGVRLLYHKDGHVRFVDARRVAEKFEDEHMRLVRELPRLKNIVLSDSAVTDEGLLHLSHLDELRCVAMPGETTNRGMEHLAGIPKLERLANLSDKVTDDGLACLDRMEFLEHLNLNGKITDAGLRHLWKAPRLKSLNLGRAQITDDGLETVGQMKNLQLLEMSNARHITNDGLKWLTGLVQLQMIGLPEKVDDGGLKHVGCLTDLRTLNLMRHPGVTNAGLSRLAELQKLTSLHLGPGITDEGLEHVVDLRALRSLDLRETKVTTQGLGQVAQGLQQLTSLYLPSTVAEEGLWRLQSLESLNSLSLRGGDITDDCVVHLLTLTNLKYVTLESTQVTPQAIATLENAMPMLKVFVYPDDR